MMCRDGLTEIRRGNHVSAVGLSVALHFAIGAAALVLIRPSRLADIDPQGIEVTFETSPERPAWPEAAPAVSSPPDSAPASPSPPLAAAPAPDVTQPPSPERSSVPEPDPLPATQPTVQAQPAPAPSAAATLHPELAPSPAPDASARAQPEVIAAAPTPVRPATRQPERQVASQLPRPVATRSLPSRLASEPASTRTRPPQAAPSQPAPPQAAAASFIIDAGWRGALAAWVRSRTRYPEEARREGREGGATVRFTVARDGQMLGVALVQGSGSEVLDAAALAIFQGAHAPPFPPDMAQTQLTVTTAVRFRLER
jgi:periplasmic protein TonB